MTNTQRFILFLLCGFIMFSIIGCATNTKVPIARVPTKVTSYPLVDYKGVEHENIQAVYRKDEDGKWNYTYIVNKNKKSFK